MAIGSRSGARGVRAERARQTRRRIVVAATESFTRDGYLETTMAVIAQGAGVAVQTLYLAFGSKVAVLAASLDVAVVGDDEPVPVMERPWFADLRDRPDAAAALALFVHEAGAIVERVYPLFAVTRDAAADPEVADVLARHKQLRFVVHETVARELSMKSGYRPGLAVPRAAAIIYALMSQETFGLLVGERGWPASDWRAWVEAGLRAQLLAP